MESKSIKEQFDELLTYTNEEEQLEHDAEMLALQFLSKIDKVMAERSISKKELAGKIGTSASFSNPIIQRRQEAKLEDSCKNAKGAGPEF